MYQRLQSLVNLLNFLKISKIYDAKENLIAVDEKNGNLYNLQCVIHMVNAVNNNVKSNENIWCRRYGHLGIDNLKLLARENLVDGFNYDVAKEFEFCEACVNGKKT